MAKRLRSLVKLCRSQLFFWVWINFLFALYASPFVNSQDLSIRNTDKQPRAALVTIAHDHELSAMLSSIRQLEERFNSRYQYHWVFFSAGELSEEFKELTSNSTNATCIYEVIPAEHWSVPSWIDRRRLYTAENAAPDVDQDPGNGKSLPDVRQIYRWNSGPFAKEKRLKDYDWFLRVKPGAQFTEDIDFDIFRYMRDNGIVYGFSETVLEETDLRKISPRIKSFIDQNPGLLHEEANVSWLLDHFGDNDDGSPAVAADDEGDLMDDEGIPSRVRHGSDGKYDRDAGSLAEAISSWLSGIYGSSLSPTFEIGSLAFFRSPNHLAFFDHLDKAGDFYYKGVDNVPLHTLSASMFLPKQSVLNFRVTRHHHHHRHHFQRPSPPRPTPDRNFALAAADSRYSVATLGGSKQAMAACFAQWEMMARDLGRQQSIPGLISGNTVVDERNFALI